MTDITMYSQHTEKIHVKKFVQHWIKDSESKGYIRLYLKDGIMIMFRPVEYKHKTGTIVSYEIADVPINGKTDEGIIVHLSDGNAANFINMMHVYLSVRNTALHIHYYANDGGDMLKNAGLHLEVLIFDVRKEENWSRVTSLYVKNVYENHMQKITAAYTEPPVPTATEEGLACG